MHGLFFLLHLRRMKHHHLISRIIVSGLLASVLVAPIATMAATLSYTQDTFVTAGGTALVIKDGSAASSFTLNTDGFTVVVPNGEQFDVRTSGSHLELQNDGLFSPCHIMTDLSNRLFITGPRTVTVRPSAYACSTVGSSDDKTASFGFSKPVAGEIVKAGQPYQLFWSTLGSGFASLRLLLSVDGGSTYPTVIADGVVNNGYDTWNVPSMTSTDKARIKIEAVDQGAVTAFSVSLPFSISGTAPVAEPTPTPTSAVPATYAGFDAEATTMAANSIDDDRSLVAAPSPASGTTVCVAGTRIKGTSSSAVYYCGRDLKRHAFPNQRIHDSWFDNFNGVVTVDDSTLAKISLGQNVDYRPGVRMIKLQTDPKTYAVASGGVLRWVQDEATAQAIYGANWNKKIDDVSDAFFFDYRVGDPLPLYVK